LSRLRARVALTVGASLLFGGLAIADTTLATSTTEPEPGAVQILPPDEPYGGATLGEWGARWMQWVYSFPEDIHPGFDTTGERCGYGQNGPVLFLPPTLVEGPQISCTVPEGTAIYVNYGYIFCSSLDEEPYFGGNEEELQACLDESSGVVEVIGTNAEDYAARSPMFTLNLPEGLPDGFLPRGPGVALAMADTIGFIIAPPPPGEHSISVTDLRVGPIR
jgi:hypothetical protein